MEMKIFETLDTILEFCILIRVTRTLPGARLIIV